ncbi:MAG: hypothetical protein JSR80_02630 [Verrucomicrobia bacterium]|nr:hypothetical protein [Verrucomicrobiota bacterium]
MAKKLFEQGIEFFTTIRKNMKQKLMGFRQVLINLR